jgi:hypothetical protein
MEVDGMTTLTRWRAAWACRVLGLWAAMSTGLLPLGCADTANNAGGEAPPAVTEGGVRVIRVERDVVSRVIAADLDDAGEGRMVTFRPFDGGPFPGGLTATMDGAGAEPFEMSMSWDEAAGSVWMRQRTTDDVFEVSRSVRAGRVHETCQLNGKRVELDYPELSEVELDKAVAHWRRGELDMAPERFRELGDAFARLDVLAAEYATTSLAANSNREALISVWNDRAFAGAIAGETIDPLRWENPARALCSYLALCMSISCRLNFHVCGFCTTGVISCLIVHVACVVIGCDCCY